MAWFLCGVLRGRHTCARARAHRPVRVFLQVLCNSVYSMCYITHCCHNIAYKLHVLSLACYATYFAWLQIYIKGICYATEKGFTPFCILYVCIEKQASSTLEWNTVPSWQWHRTGSSWSPVWILPVAPLWCVLGFFLKRRGNKAVANLEPPPYHFRGKKIRWDSACRSESGCTLAY